MRREFILGFTLFSILIATVAFAQEIGTNENPYEITKASSAIRVDGKMDETAWKTALSVELIYEVMPGDSTPATVRTLAYLTYDDDMFYVAFRAWDPDMTELKARYTDHDKAFDDDRVGINIDTFNDNRRAYRFLANPLGVQMDLLYDEVNGVEDQSWNAIWYTASTILDDGYIVEIGVPFSQINFKNTDGEQTWGFTAERTHYRDMKFRLENRKRDRSNNSLLSQMPKMRGFAGIKPKTKLEIVPTITAHRTDELDSFPDGEMVEKDSKADVGVTAKWGVTPNITASATLNPDFSQVEADEIQLGINENFTLYFDETRPFFLESYDYFNTPAMRLLYTRSIVDPNAAVKLTGKQGKHTFALLATEDDFTAIMVPGSTGSFSKSFDVKSQAGVGRYRYDFGSNSTVGAMFTGRKAGDYQNGVFDIDGFFRLNRSDSITFHAVGTSTTYSQEMADSLGTTTDNLAGRALFAQYQHNGRNFRYGTSYLDISSDFRADLGYIPRVNLKEYSANSSYVWYGNGQSFYNMVQVSAEFEYLTTQENDMLERDFALNLFFMGQKNSLIFSRLGFKKEAFLGKEYEMISSQNMFEITPSKDSKVGLAVGFGDAIDYSNNREATSLLFSPSLNYKLGRHIDLTYRHTYQTLDVDGGRLFTTNVPEGRVVYQHNARMFVRLLMQYVSLEREAELYNYPVQPEIKQLLTQLLFSYKLNPQTVLYLGYSDSSMGMQSIDMIRMDRTFFVKMGYAWLM
jgi:hypothetical protein